MKQMPTFAASTGSSLTHSPSYDRSRSDQFWANFAASPTGQYRLKKAAPVWRSAGAVFLPNRRIVYV